MTVKTLVAGVDVNDAAGSTGQDVADTVNALQTFVLLDEFGAVGDSDPTFNYDNSAAIAAAIAYADSVGAAVTGNSKLWYPVKAPVTFTGKAGCFNLKIVAATGFSGAYVVGFGTESVPNTSDFGVSRLTVDANSMAAIGISFVNFQRVPADSISVENNSNIGVKVGPDGYELYGTNINISGPIPPKTAAPDTSVGFQVLASDCSFVNVASSRNAVGVDVIGSGNRFSMMHSWGTYYIGHCRMRICYHVKGQNNIFNGVTIDSPSRLAWGSASSLANGGYGMLIDTNAVDTQVINPYLFLSSAGDDKPTSQSIIPIYTDRARVLVSSPKVRNDSGTADAVTNFVQTSTTAVLRNATITGVTGSSATMPENLYITDSFTQWTPDLKIGGASTGITYGNRRAMFKRVGSMAFFNININLTSKGSLTGALTVDLQVANLNEYADYKLVFQALIETQSGTLPAVGVLANNTVSIALRNPETNAALTDAAITNTSRITITGSFLTSTV
jgi:hypothetical protein